MAEPKGAFDSRLYSSTQPDVQVLQPFNVSAIRRPTYVRLFYAFALAAIIWFAGATFSRSVVHFVPTVPWVS